MKKLWYFEYYGIFLLLAIKMCAGFTTNVIWINTKVYNVTSEPSHNSSRRVSSFKDSSVLLNI